MIRPPDFAAVTTASERWISSGEVGDARRARPRGPKEVLGRRCGAVQQGHPGVRGERLGQLPADDPRPDHDHPGERSRNLLQQPGGGHRGDRSMGWNVRRDRLRGLDRGVQHPTQHRPRVVAPDAVRGPPHLLAHLALADRERFEPRADPVDVEHRLRADPDGPGGRRTREEFLPALSGLGRSYQHDELDAVAGAQYSDLLGAGDRRPGAFDPLPGDRSGDGLEFVDRCPAQAHPEHRHIQGRSLVLGRGGVALCRCGAGRFISAIMRSNRPRA